MSDDKPPLPANLRPLADKAIAKHRNRPVPPKVLVEGEEDCPPRIESPYAPEDDDAWRALLYQAFGTRSHSVATYFLQQLSDLCRRDWDEEARKWRPSEDELNAVISMVNSMKPRDEAQAAYAAQLCALHLSAMRMAQHTTTHYADARSLAVLNKTVRAFGDGLANLQRLQGKSRTSRQTIRVESHKHVHQHVHLSDGGSAGNGGQSHTPNGAATIEGSATVPGQGAFGEVVSLAGRSRVPRLPDARRAGGRSKG